MFKQTALVTFQPDIAPDAKASITERMNAFSGATRNEVQPVVHGANAGHVVWHLYFPDEAAWRQAGAPSAADAIAEDTDVLVVDATAYAPDPVQLPRPDLTDGIYRALFVSMNPQVPADTEALWRAEIRAMPRYISQILNASTAKTVWSRGRLPWTHVWEQEYVQLSDLNGPYLQHAYHWGHVDRWFDPEMPDCIMANDLCHSASMAPNSLIAGYAA